MPKPECFFKQSFSPLLIPHLLKFPTSLFTPCTRAKKEFLPAGSFWRSCNQQWCSLDTRLRGINQTELCWLTRGLRRPLLSLFLNQQGEQRPSLIESDRPVSANWSRFSSHLLCLIPSRRLSDSDVFIFLLLSCLFAQYLSLYIFFSILLLFSPNAAATQSKSLVLDDKNLNLSQFFLILFCCQPGCLPALRVSWPASTQGVRP